MLRKLYDWTLAKAAHPHAEWWLAAFSFVEASFFPIPPHPLLGIMCLAEPRKAIRFALIATLASVAGGVLGYAIGWGLYDTVGTQLLALLGLTESFPQAACYLREYGAEIIMIKGATPIPFKLLTITAGFIAMPLVTFILASLVSRAISFMILGLATAGFVILVVGGFIAATMLGGGGDDSAKCAAATLAVLA
jgi:membrane protein YqaA with SNARE-associated domain